MTFLGIDLGTSSIKGAVLDLEAPAVTKVLQLPFPPPVCGLPPLFHEVDPTEILSSTSKLITELLAVARDCAGILLCGQMGGLVLTNHRGEALSNYISWQDRRATLPHPNGNGSYFDHFSQLLG